jgi:hypothetical protein
MREVVLLEDRRMPLFEIALGLALPNANASTLSVFVSVSGAATVSGGKPNISRTNGIGLRNAFHITYHAATRKKRQTSLLKRNDGTLTDRSRC